MKSSTEIFSTIVNKLSSRSNARVKRGTVLDNYIVGTSEAIEEAHIEIQNNRTPHIYTDLSGSELDSLGLWVGLKREPKEIDSVYLKRLMDHRAIHASSNIIAINDSLLNMNYASHVNYVPMTEGTSTATAFIIPKTYSGNGPQLAINETIQRLKNVTSPSTYITYQVPVVRPVVVGAEFKATGDIENIKKNIEQRMRKYINSIVPGERLELGLLEYIGINTPGIKYFNVYSIIIDGETINSLSVLQKLDSKFLFDKISWILKDMEFEK